MSKEYKGPDVKAPRYRSKTTTLLTKDIYKKFLEKYPEYKEHDFEEFKKNISIFNEAIWKTALEYRDGVDLPEGLGNVFIGTCWKKKKTNVDFYKSAKYKMLITNQNYETDGKLGKIFYTNYNNKYRFTNRVMWMFKGCRDFKRTMGKTYPEQWKKYIHIDPSQKINKLYKRQQRRDFMKNQQERMLDYYNEFDMD